jgi:DNA-binding IclR family transcriptional regulator
VGTVSLKSEAASRSVSMLHTAMGPVITGWLEDPAIDARIASAAKPLIEADISLPALARILARAAHLQITEGAA